MGYPGAPLLLYDRPDYVRALPEDTPSPVLSQPQPTATSSPATPPAQGGSFWGGVLDVLKNVPLTIGGPGRRIQLPSYNQMTAGTRFLDYGRKQGLDLPKGSVSPEEAYLMVQDAARRRLTDPMGMDVAQEIMPPQRGELPSTMQTRAWIARLPRSALQPLLLEQIKEQGGLPGFGGSDLDLSALGAHLPRRGDAAAAAPSQPGPTLQPPGLSGTGTAPATAPMVQQAPQPQTPLGAQALPSPPSRPGPITYEDVAAHPTVVAAQQLLRTAPGNRKYRELYAQAWAKAEQDLRASRHQQYGEQSQEFRNTLAAQQAYMAMQKALLEAQRAPYGYGTELDAQIRLDWHLPQGVMPTQDQANVSRGNLQRYQLLQKEEEARAGKIGSMSGEVAARSGMTLLDAMGADAEKARAFRDPQTGYPLPADTPWNQAQRAPQVTGKTGENLDTLLDVMPTIQELNRMTMQLYGPGGLYERLTPTERAAIGQVGSRAWHQLNQEHPELETMRGFVEGNAEALARGLGGVRGAGTEGDVQRAKAMLAAVTETFGFQMKGWIPTFQWNRPDTRAVALSKLNTLNRMLDQRVGAMMRNPQFEHPGLMPRMTPEQLAVESQKTSGAIGAYRPDVGPQGMTPEQIKATPTRPPTGPAPLSPSDAMKQVQQTALRQHRLTQPPNAQQQPAEFKAFMGTVREQVRRYFKSMPPEDQHALTQRIAQRLGGQWP